MSYISILRESAESLYPQITEEISAQSVKKYKDDTLTLAELDHWRNVEFPSLLAKRYSLDDLHVSKDELLLLMDWKLAKGKFRPTLPKLIKSNDDENVKIVTVAGFAIFLDYSAELKWKDVTLDDYKKTLRSSLKKLCELKGVGPATGSLLLSLLNKITQIAPPYFSDEAYMYFIRDPLHPGLPIKYTVKEYVEEYVGLLLTIAKKDSISMDELEKGGWALKMYHLYRIDKLADIKLPFKIDDDRLQEFGEARTLLPEEKVEVKARKRTAPKSETPRKRVKN